MPKAEKLAIDVLDNEHKQMLLALANMIVPPNKERGLPGAADVGIVEYVQSEGHTSWVCDGLRTIAEESHKSADRGFSSLTTSEQASLIDGLRRKLTRYFINLTNLVVECYYQHDDVLKAIGLEARTPFPDGYLVEEGDLSLLESVYERGKIYRD